MTRTRGMVLATLLACVVPAAASELTEFARCVSRAGATYYTADWCPHCARQNRLFGNALGYLRVVDCTDGCDDVKSLPSWTFRDGSRVSGFQSLQALAGRTGCRLGDAPEPAVGERTRAPSGTGGRERYIGGAKIIEVR